MNTKVVKLLNRPRTVAGTPEWTYERHTDCLSATQISSVLECNPYKSKRDLFLEKILPYEQIIQNSGSVQPINQDACQWGNTFEPIAKRLYETRYGVTIMDVGLVRHSEYPFIGATPDGVSAMGKLLEIKCPWKRKLVGDIPYPYWVQMQIQMEVCNLDECDYYECKFIQYDSRQDFEDDDWNPKGSFVDENGTIVYWKLRKQRLMTVERDREWFQRVIPKLQNFWNEIQETREKYGNKAPDYGVSTIYHRTRSHDFNHHYMSHDWDEWVPARAISNYLRNDPILDWLNQHGRSKMDFKHDAKDELPVYNQANFARFQSAVMENLSKRFNSNEITVIAHNSEILSTEKANLTIECMRRGIPIIANPVLHDTTTKVCGVPLALVRHDYLPKLVKNYNKDWHGFICNKNSSKLGTDWCYYLVDFSFSTIKINPNNEHVYEDIYSKSAKGVTYLLNKCLGKIQGFTPSYSLVLSRKLRVNDEPYTMFYRYVLIDHNKNSQAKKATEAIEWLKEVRRKGNNWSVVPPSDYRLYPNMSNGSDYPWHNTKKEIANDIKEITSLWQCGPKQRQKAHEAKHLRWDQADGFNSQTVGFKNQRADTFDKMLYVNGRKDLKVNFNLNHSVYSIVKAKEKTRPQIEKRMVSSRNAKTEALFKIHNLYEKQKRQHHNNNKNINNNDINIKNTPFVMPQKLSKEIKKATDMSWKTNNDEVEFFVDFEYFNQTDHEYPDIVFFDTKSRREEDYMVQRSGLIYMIGVGYQNLNGNWVYRDFTINDVLSQNENDIINEWVNYMLEVRRELGLNGHGIRIYHWSGAEFYQLHNVLEKQMESSYNREMKRQKFNISWKKYFENETIMFYDLMDVFKNIPIVINGCFSFGLKNVASSLCKHGLISTTWASKECIDGGSAMALAWEIYHCHDPYKFCRIMKQIREYNEIDCQVLWEVLNFLRKKY